MTAKENSIKDHTVFTARLILSHPPLSNYEFVKKNEAGQLQQFLEKSMLYAIVQRAELTFENAEISTELLSFKIKKRGASPELVCKVPIRQKAIMEEKKEIKYYFLDHGMGNEPGSNLKAIQLSDMSDKVLLSITPDYFLWAHSHGYLKADIQGDIQEFIEFKALYIGKATDQNVCKRLATHGSLQKILSVEGSINADSTITHELVLLLFQVTERTGVTISPTGASISAVLDSMISGNMPTPKILSLDAEKALIKLLNPQYNTVKYKTYPKSDDGMYKFGYNEYSYIIPENLHLQYNSVSVAGNVVPEKADIIVIKNNNELFVLHP